MWHAFVAPFPMGSDECLVRVGTATEPFNRLHELQRDAPFALTAPSFAAIGHNQSAVRSIDAQVLEHGREFRQRGHWLRAPMAWVIALPSVVDAITERITGTKPTWQRPDHDSISSFGAARPSKRHMDPARALLGQVAGVGASSTKSTSLSPIQQAYALLRDGRCLSLAALCRLIDPPMTCPVNRESLSSMLSRNPDFRFIDGMGWVLAAAQDAERAKAGLIALA